MKRIIVAFRNPPVRRRLTRIGSALIALVAANFVATTVWAARNPCLRSHAEYPSHIDANGDTGGEVCDWYKTDPDRNPWLPGNEWRTVRNLVAP